MNRYSTVTRLVQQNRRIHRWRRAALVWAVPLMLGQLLLLASACAPGRQPTPTPSPAPLPTSTPIPPTPTLVPTPTLILTPTSGEAYVGGIEGLVMSDDGQLIIGVQWLSKSRVAYVVKGGEVEEVRKFLGETAQVTGEIVELNPWMKEITIRTVKASTGPGRLSMRRGYIQELGPSIYMQGTHVLVDREGKLICLLSAKESGLDLDAYIMSKVVVIGVMSKTVEGDAQIMEVEAIERAKP